MGVIDFYRYLLGYRFLNFGIKDSRYNDNVDITIIFRDLYIEIRLYTTFAEKLSSATLVFKSFRGRGKVLR